MSRGAPAAPSTFPTSSECELAEIAPGAVYLDARIESPDAGRRLGVEPRRRAHVRRRGHRRDAERRDVPGLAGWQRGSRERPAELLLVNASGASTKRERLVARISRDGGRTFGARASARPRSARRIRTPSSFPDGTAVCLLRARGETRVRTALLDSLRAVSPRIGLESLTDG